MNYMRKQEEKRRLKKMIDSWWPCGAYESQKPNRKPYLKRYWKSQGKNSCWAWNKRQAHKSLRRKLNSTDENLSYNKSYDLWWSVW